MPQHTHPRPNGKFRMGKLEKILVTDILMYALVVVWHVLCEITALYANRSVKWKQCLHQPYCLWQKDQNTSKSFVCSLRHYFHISMWEIALKWLGDFYGFSAAAPSPSSLSRMQTASMPACSISANSMNEWSWHESNRSFNAHRTKRCPGMGHMRVQCDLLLSISSKAKPANHLVLFHISIIYLIEFLPAQ